MASALRSGRRGRLFESDYPDKRPTRNGRPLSFYQDDLTEKPAVFCQVPSILPPPDRFPRDFLSGVHLFGVLPRPGVVDDAGPVQAVGEVVGVAFGIDVGPHVVRDVLGLFLDGAHVGRQLHRQQA